MGERSGGRRGTADRLKGKAKEMAGKVTGDDRMRGEGRADQVKGRAQEAMERTKETLAGARDAMRGKESERGKESMRGRGRHKG